MFDYWFIKFSYYYFICHQICGISSQLLFILSHHTFGNIIGAPYYSNRRRLSLMVKDKDGARITTSCKCLGVASKALITSNHIPYIGLSSLDDYECGLINSSSPDDAAKGGGHPVEVAVKPRRRRAKVKMKNKEDIENQRMTHIVVERNRRKQMNEYLKVLRSLMPDSYVPRGDQASIVGGAINFVKELEHNLQCLSANKHMIKESSSSLPYQEFFTSPQYSTTTLVDNIGCENDYPPPLGGGGRGGGIAVDIEVTMVENHANLKIRLKKSLKQLSKLVYGLSCLRLTILHVNVNTSHGLVLYSFTLKVEDDAKWSTVDIIAKEVYNLLGRIQEDQPSFSC